MPTRASYWEFLRALSGETLTAMSGVLSVPFTALSVWVDNKYAQPIFATMAIACAWYAAYRIWIVERKRADSLAHSGNRQALLDGISELREQLVRLRIDMQKDFSGQISIDDWKERFKTVETQIGEKIEYLAGKAEAKIYLSRGNIKRIVSSIPHQLYIDIVIHDLDHLKEFIKDYSRGKK